MMLSRSLTNRCSRWLTAYAAMLVTSVATAADSPQDKLKSLFDGVAGKTAPGGTEGPSSTHLLAFAMLGFGVITILVWYNNREQKPKKVRQVNHSRKLMKQITRQIGLAGDEVRQLKVLADIHQRTTGQTLQNPLTLLLCPSLLTHSLETNDLKIDRQVISRLARRISQKAKA